MSGWIRIHRKIKDSFVWQDKPYSKGQAWIDLLLAVNYDDKNIIFDGNLLLVRRGSCITSVRKLAEKWGWSKDKVSKFLSLLEKDGMIDKDTNSKRTLITIANYGFYQDCKDSDKDTNNDKKQDNENNDDKVHDRDTDETPKRQRADTEKTLTGTNNNINNYNNINNNTYISPEPEISAPDGSGILMPLNDKSFYNVQLKRISEWELAYPAVNISGELRKMIAWLNANPNKKKTRRGVERFIVNWLSKEQDRGGGGYAANRTSRGNQSVDEFTEMLKTMNGGKDDF